MKSQALNSSKTLSSRPSIGTSIAARLAVLLFVAVALRHVADWLRFLSGWPIPSLGNVGYTLIFSGFAVLHGCASLGKRRTLVFFTLSAIVSWILEEIGVSTGWVYGHYHYSDMLGPKLGLVPVIIPLAWFMMIYSSWAVASALLGSATQDASECVLSRSIVASVVMTSWDTVMDPGMSRAGNWVWETGGAYFGVPVHNYAGWLATTFVVYLLFGITSRYIRPASVSTGDTRCFDALPVMCYAMVAVDHLVVQIVPELRVVDVFTMGFATLLACIGLARKRAMKPELSESASIRTAPEVSIAQSVMSPAASRAAHFRQT
ncbi:carotenoid biosynthesis protein [Paraburkholderia sp. RL17-337-BIB-A]|uniref:carotenoid biosynthesis protein n=1 Tax=Paraburkholderia sp. RL17-337-BIB-A TaxID=3031636 RepID=UPI0038BC57A6